MRRLLIAVVVIAIAAGGGIYALTGGDSKLTAVVGDPIGAAAEKTSNVKSEHVDLDATVTASGKTVHMTGEGDYTDGDRLGTLTVKAPGMKLTAIQRDLTMYMTSDAFKDQIPNGKHWFKLDLSKSMNAMGVDLASQSPKSSLAHLAHTGDVKKVGVETIDGLPATHYRATINASEVPKKLLALTGVRYDPVDVWVGKDGMIYRFSMGYTVDMSGSDAHTVMTMSFSRFGERVSITIPPASDVYDATKMALSQIGAGK